jgi:outer membrane biosynthesis protein TonB
MFEPEPEPTSVPSPEPRLEPTSAPSPEPKFEPTTAPEPEPSHVDSDVELVAESADAGAEDAAGAAVRVDPPWAGYGKLKAADVIDRLAAEDTAALSVVLLYERSHRARRSVIEATERELARRATPVAR